MNTPRFTAVASLYKTSGCYQSQPGRGFGNRNADFLVYPQKPNKDNVEGGKCCATSASGQLYVCGKYNSNGYCCVTRPNGDTHCVNCDTGTCDDKAFITGDIFAVGAHDTVLVAESSTGPGITGGLWSAARRGMDFN